MRRHEVPEGARLGREWWGPLEDLVRRVQDDPRRRFLAVEDFMVMSRIRRPPRPAILVYKHSFTRQPLHLDAEGITYRFHPPPPGSTGSGQYRRYSAVDDALDALRLFELPWMKPGLEGERRGLRWEDRHTLRMWLEDGRLDDDITCLICRDRQRDARRRIGDDGWILHAVDDDLDPPPRAAPRSQPLSASPTARPPLRLVAPPEVDDLAPSW